MSNFQRHLYPIWSRVKNGQVTHKYMICRYFFTRNKKAIYFFVICFNKKFNISVSIISINDKLDSIWNSSEIKGYIMICICVPTQQFVTIVTILIFWWDSLSHEWLLGKIRNISFKNIGNVDSYVMNFTFNSSINPNNIIFWIRF